MGSGTVRPAVTVVSPTQVIETGSAFGAVSESHVASVWTSMAAVITRRPERTRRESTILLVTKDDALTSNVSPNDLVLQDVMVPEPMLPTSLSVTPRSEEHTSDLQS